VERERREEEKFYWIWVKDNERPHSLEAGWSGPDKNLSFSLSPPLSMSIHLV
jgi:hypothetical protein